MICEITAHAILGFTRFADCMPGRLFQFIWNMTAAKVVINLVEVIESSFIEAIGLFTPNTVTY